jgi:WD40 repeat protein
MSRAGLEVGGPGTRRNGRRKSLEDGSEGMGAHGEVLTLWSRDPPTSHKPWFGSNAQAEFAPSPLEALADRHRQITLSPMLIRKALSRLVIASLLGFAGMSPGAEDSWPTPRRTFGLGEVGLLAMSSDIRFLASAGPGGAFVWDIEGSRFRHRLDQMGGVTALAFASDGKVLLTASADRIVAWEPESGKVQKEFLGHRRGIYRLRFGTDGDRFASASDDNTARVWSMTTGAMLHQVQTPGSPIGDVALSPDGLRLATVDTFLTNAVKIWDLSTESVVGVLPMTNSTAQRCLYAANGDLVTVTGDRQVTRWDAETGKPLQVYEGMVGEVTMVHDLWFPNETTLAVACNDGQVYLWSLASGLLLKVVPGELAVASSGVAGDALVIQAGLDYSIGIRQLPSGDTLRRFVGHTTSTHSSVAFSPDGRFVLSGGTEASTRLWDRQTGALLRTLVGSPAGTMAGVFSSDGRRVLTTVGLPNPGARLWKTETGEVERDFRWAGSWPSSAAISKDGLRVAAGAQDSQIRIFDAGTGALLRTLAGSGWIARLAFSPTAPLLLSGEGVGEYHAVLYNHESGQRLHVFEVNAGPVTAVEFSPSGNAFLVGWQDGLVRIYDAFTLELKREIVVQAGFLDAAAFSPDGRWVLTGESFPSFNATLWDAGTGERVRAFPGHGWVVGAVAFDAAGTGILTGADVVREWSIADLATRLRIERMADHSRIRWEVGRLEVAADPAGPWQTVTNAVSPYREPGGRPSGFYRVRVE